LYERYFIANNTTLIFIGGVTLQEMIPLVDHYFGWMKRQPEPMRVKAVEPKPQAEKRLIWRSTVLTPRMEMRFLIPAVGHPDRPHFDVLAEVLDLQLVSALEKENLKGRVNVNTRVVHTRRFGVPASLNIEVIQNDEKRLPEVEGIILSTLEEMKDNSIPLEYLNLAKKRLRTEWHRTALNADRLGFEIGHFQIMDSWRTLKPYLKARESTSSETINRLAGRYMIEQNRSVGVVVPPVQESKAEEDTE